MMEWQWRNALARWAVGINKELGGMPREDTHHSSICQDGNLNVNSDRPCEAVAHPPVVYAGGTYLMIRPER